MSRWLNSGERFRVNAQMAPEKMGVKDLARSMTFKELNDRTCRLAGALLNLGLRPGDRLAVLARNRVEWMEIYGAAAKAGLVVVPILFRLAPPEVEYIVKDSGAKAIIVETPFFDCIDSMRNRLPGLNHLIYLGLAPIPDGFIHYESLAVQGPAEETGIRVDHKDIWAIMYTSGTTGRPKGAVRTHESFIASFILHAAELGFRREDYGLMVMPMCHLNSLAYAFTLNYIQAQVCIYDRTSFEPEDLLGVLSQEKISFTSLVPTHYLRMLSLPESVRQQYDLSATSKLMCSSAPARREIKADIMALFPKAQLFEGYGSTEAGLVTLLRPEDQLRKLGSIGREIIGLEKIRLLDDDRQDVPVGQVGELFSKGPGLFSSYWNQPEQTERAFYHGLFSAGDMARQDEEGYYYLVDRKKNMIITGGENVYPSEIEQVIGAHPQVREVAVIGVPDAQWGESIKAVVVLDQDADPTGALEVEIMEYCRGRIAGYKSPREIEFIKEQDMPRTASGKILYRALRDKNRKV